MILDDARRRRAAATDVATVHPSTEDGEYHPQMTTKADKKYEAWLATKALEADEKPDDDHQRVPPPKTGPIAQPEPEEIAAAQAELVAAWGVDPDLARIYATARIYFPGVKIVSVRPKAIPRSTVADGTNG